MITETRILATALISMFITGAVGAQATGLITSNSAGKVKIGMTVAEVRRAVAPMTISRISDGEGVALIAVRKGKTQLMTIYAGEEDRDKAIDNKARVEQIWVWDKAMRTAAGARPGMKLADLVPLYGKIKGIIKSEIESREFAFFENHPKGIDFRLDRVDGSGGIYSAGERRTTQYHPDAVVLGIHVVGSQFFDFFEKIGKDEPAFTSELTELKTGCRYEGGEDGGHVSVFCKGPGGYRMRFDDTATTWQARVENENGDWSRDVRSFPVGSLKDNKPVEWRLANGVPFAVIFTDPKDGTVTVTGLKGFERIRTEETGPDALDNARHMAGEQYAEAVIPATRIYLTARSATATVKGTIKSANDKLKYVFKAKAGYTLKVSLDADKWDGEDGPVLVVTLSAPDGSGWGEPGGLKTELTQDGDYEILIDQNRAKSRAENIEVTITVTITAKGS